MDFVTDAVDRWEKDAAQAVVADRISWMERLTAGAVHGRIVACPLHAQASYAHGSSRVQSSERNDHNEVIVALDFNPRC